MASVRRALAGWVIGSTVLIGLNYASERQTGGAVAVHRAIAHDVSHPLALAPEPDEEESEREAEPSGVPVMRAPAGSASIEQRAQGQRAPAAIVASFDGLGFGFEGPQGAANFRNPSDNSLAVGRDHIVQTVNSRMAIFTKRGRRFDMTGRALYGPVPTNNVFRGFGGPCETRNNGDAVVRYDQLADRWLIVMPIFSRNPVRPDEPAAPKADEPAQVSVRGQPGQPGPAERLYEPPPQPPQPPPTGTPPARGGQAVQQDRGSYAMCYALSVGPDPFGPYYRYAFVRPLFPDYPRPAVWPDGYYVPTSTGDEVIQKHACVVDRAKMLEGKDATEQCVIIDGVNFLNNADLDGKQLPPPGAPNIMMAAGGTQLKNVMEDDGIQAWSFHVDWKDPSKTRVDGPTRIAVAPYRYLCDGQLTSCVPQPGTSRRLDAQGDKIMARLVYRRIGNRESVVAVHSVNTSTVGGGVRWYEFRVDDQRRVNLYQQGTYAPDQSFRWMASPAIDAKGNIGIGYSFGGTPFFAGQRFAGRLSDDPKGQLTLAEAVLAEGEAPQTTTLRWEDYAQTAVDPSDDCTIWYVGDYLKKDATTYSSRIGGFRMPGCGPAPTPEPAPNALSAAERSSGWRLLFDGRSLRGWRGLGYDSVPTAHWTVVDGTIRKIPSGSVPKMPDGQPASGGDLMTADTFNDFELSFDWKVAPGANSGVKYNVSEEFSLKNATNHAALGFEYQVLDDDLNEDNKIVTHRAGSLYDLIAPNDRKRLMSVGGWNRSVIVFRGRHGEHWLNGEKVVAYDLGTPLMDSLLAKSKYRTIPGFADRRAGHIILQDHGDEVFYRSIKIRELTRP
jgi:hypothetical protein